MWHKRIDSMITPLTLNSRYVIGVEITQGSGNNLYLLQVYLPCKTHSMWTYKNCIEDLENIVCRYVDRGKLMIMGDYNTELPTRYQRDGVLDNRGNILVDLMMRHNLVAIHSLDACDGAEFSNVPFNSERQTLIDHRLVQQPDIESVKSCSIIEDDSLNFSTHRPIMCTLRMPHYKQSNSPSRIINWRNIKYEHISIYEEHMNNNSILREFLNKHIETNADIDNMYLSIVQVINNVTNACIPKTEFKPYIKPYWNDALSRQHKLMKSQRMKWIDKGRPRGDAYQSYREYKSAKRDFERKHREAIYNYITELEKELDSAAELDNNEFWRLINKRKPRVRGRVIGSMEFNGTTYTNPEDILVGWRQYFETLYNITAQTETLDNIHIQEKQELTEIISNLPKHTLDHDINIDEQLVQRALKLCKKNKSAGYDNVFYENIIYGGDLLIKVLTKLYKHITDSSHIPSEMKRGIIVPLFKGGNKKKSDPNSYRAISLCSTILKLYEKTLIHAQKDNPLFKPNPLQGGFQEHVNCVMTSFILRESVYFANENNSKVYACFLDAHKAYDTVDHTILMRKLYKTGIDITLFKVILDMFKDVYSCVRVNGQTSELFPILQGTRQGQSISPLLYLIFINDLIDKVEKSEDCLRINNTSYGCPTSADDMVLLSLSKNGLDRLIDLCFKNSLNERYRYNIEKCNIVVFNESNHEAQGQSRSWTMGADAVEEIAQYTHLGVLCDKRLNIDENIKQSCAKLRKTFFSLSNYGVHREGIHPLTAKHLYQTCIA